MTEGAYTTFTCCYDEEDSLTLYGEEGASEGDEDSCIMIECSQEARHAFVHLSNEDARELARRILARVPSETED